MKIKCHMCDGTGEYWLAKGLTCRTCQGTGQVEISIPTQENDEWWLGVTGKSGNNFGKWLLFVDKRKIDAVWAQIRQETQDEKLGVEAKVSTRKYWIHKGMPKDYVVCVYTNEDKTEIDRVRNRLKELGFIDTLGYKTNEATRQASEELLYEY